MIRFVSFSLIFYHDVPLFFKKYIKSVLEIRPVSIIRNGHHVQPIGVKDLFEMLLISVVVRLVTGILAACDIVDGIHHEVDMGMIPVHMDGVDDLILAAIVGGGLPGDMVQHGIDIAPKLPDFILGKGQDPVAETQPLSAP